MAAADVLRSNDPLIKTHGLHNRKNTRCVPNPETRSRRSKRIPPTCESKGRNTPVTRRVPDPTVSTSIPASKKLVMGKVTILKRGEPLPEKKKIPANRSDDADLVLCSSGRLGPEPQDLGKQFASSELYAGLSSPDPSSLPFPKFGVLPKNEKRQVASLLIPTKEKMDIATCNLLRILRLDLSLD